MPNEASITRRRRRRRKRRPHRPPKSCSLISLAYFEKWQQLSQCAPYYTDELTETNEYGSLPLHIACGSADSVDIYVLRELLNAAPHTASITDNEGSTPLHFLLHYGSPNLVVLRLLLEAHVPSVAMRDLYGRTPLFHAVDNSLSYKHIKLLLDVGGDFAKESILQPCGPTREYTSPLTSRGKDIARQRAHRLSRRPEYARTPLYIAWHDAFHHQDNDLDESSDEDSDWDSDCGNTDTPTSRSLDSTVVFKKKRWNKAMLLLQAAYEHHKFQQRGSRSQCNDDGDFSMLHAVIALRAHLPSAVLDYVLRHCMDQATHADKDGMLPLHIVAATYSPNLSRTSRSSSSRSIGEDNDSHNDHDSDHVTTSVIEALLEAYPQAATVSRSKEGRLPFHYAIASGMTWDMDSFQYLLGNVHAHYVHDGLGQVYDTVDPTTGLYAFLLAAASDGEEHGNCTTKNQTCMCSSHHCLEPQCSNSFEHDLEHEHIICTCENNSKEELIESDAICNGDLYSNIEEALEEYYKEGSIKSSPRGKSQHPDDQIPTHGLDPLASSFQTTRDSRKLDTIFELMLASPTIAFR